MAKLPRKLNILVTSIGGDIGQSVAKVIRGFDTTRKIIGTDIKEDFVASFFSDKFFLVPKPSKAYKNKLEIIVKQNDVDLIFPISEPELKFIHQHFSDYKLNKAAFVMAKGKFVTLCFDKFETIMFLKKMGVLTPWTIKTTGGLPIEFPCILKDRWGWGSKGMIEIHNIKQARELARRRPNAIFQQKLLPSTEEYTCGIFRSRRGRIATVVFKRELRGGMTSKAEVVDDRNIEALCELVAESLDLRGSINLQLIKTARGPIPFEINARFSSTVVFREMVGFRDVLWSILDTMGADFDISFKPRGQKVFRLVTEVIVK